MITTMTTRSIGLLGIAGDSSGARWVSSVSGLGGICSGLKAILPGQRLVSSPNGTIPVTKTETTADRRWDGISIHHMMLTHSRVDLRISDKNFARCVLQERFLQHLALVSSANE